MLIHRLLEEYRSRGTAVSIGELVEQAMRLLWRQGVLDLGFEAGVVGQLTPEPEIADQDSVGRTEASDTGRPGRKRTVPISEHKILAVIVSVAETGESWMRTHNGIVPVRLADLSGLAPVVQVARLSDLHRQLAQQAGKTKTMPAIGRLYVAAVSGGRCQRKGCNRPLKHIHHLTPRAKAGDHGPENLAGLCGSCHDEVHGEFVANPSDHPGEWTPVEPGRGPAPDAVSRAYRQIRREAARAGFRTVESSGQGPAASPEPPGSVR